MSCFFIEQILFFSNTVAVKTIEHEGLSYEENCSESKLYMQKLGGIKL